MWVGDLCIRRDEVLLGIYTIRACVFTVYVHVCICSAVRRRARSVLRPVQIDARWWRWTQLTTRRRREFPFVLFTRSSGVYFKRGVQPKCGVENEKCGVQD